MKCYRRAVLQEVRLYGELHRFVPVAGRGPRLSRRRNGDQPSPAPIRPLEVWNDPLRQGFSRPLDGKVSDRFGQRPQHLLGTVGLASFVLGALGLLWLAGWWVVSRLPGMEPIHLQQRPALIYALGLLLLGGQLMSIGFLAELFIAYHVPDTQGYSISERTPSSLKILPPHAMTDSVPTAAPELRRSVYLLLICLSTGAMLGRILAVDSVDKIGVEANRRPFLSANVAAVGIRSGRWSKTNMRMRALPMPSTK